MHDFYTVLLVIVTIIYKEKRGKMSEHTNVLVWVWRYNRGGWTIVGDSASPT